MLPLGVLVLAALAVGSPLTRSPAPGNAPGNAPGAAPEQLFIRRDHPDHKSPLGLAEPVRPAAHNPLRRRATPDAPDTPTTNGLDAAASYFLPTDIRPTYYNMTLAPNMTTFTFNGQVQIFFNVIKSTNKIVFHAKQLTWKDADVEVYLASGEDGLDYFADIVKVERNSFNEQVTLTLSEPLQAKSHYMLWFPSFDGKLNDDLDGFYRSSYMANGEKRWLATTQFEPTGARRAFPCWDEPSFKARFEIYIKHDPMLNAISNMPSSQQTGTEDGQVITAFSQTLPMSSYLVAFIVSDFGTETNEKGNFSTWARKDILSGSGMSQQLGPQALQVLANFNGIDYMMPKMDQAAIPDFEAGAMENWGLVTYREPYLITNSDMKASEEERIATVICHEFGHQWTGDLVTLGWWSHTWLNEGFATFYESMTCAEIKPEWNLEDKMLPNYYHVAMESDVREDQISMCNPVSSYDEIENMFGVISYKKGGSVLRMFYHAMTPEVFKMAMKRYLSIRMYKNSSPEHLFSAFEYAANSTDPSLIPEGYTFRDLMRTFTDFAGVPLVTVTRDYDDQVVEFKQERFFYTAPSDPTLVEQAWWIPLTVVSGDKPEWSTRPQSWLNPEQTVSQAASDVPADQWLLINPKQTGYFRVNYDKKNWKLLSAALAANPSTFPAATRAQLLNDALAMAQADRLDYAVALTFFQAFKKEREVAPWQAAVTAIQYLTARLANTPVYPSFLALIKDITADAYDSVGYTTADKDSHDTKYLRYYMASYACWSGNEKCLSAAAAALKTWMANPKTNKMQPDTRDTSMCYGLRASDAATFQAMAKLWQDEKDATLRTTYLSALSCSADSGLITSLLADSLTKYSVDDGVAVFNAVYDRRENHNVLMDFVKKNAPAIRKRFENNFDYQVLDGLIRDIRTREEYAEVQSWVYQTYGDTDGYDNLKASFQSVEMDLVTWYDKFYTSTSVWLSAAEPITTQAPTQGPTHGPTQGPTGMPSTTTTTPAGAATTTLSTTLILAGLLSAMLHLLH